MDTNHSQSDFAAILDHVKACENKAQSLAWQIYKLLGHTKQYKEEDLTALQEACQYAAQQIGEAISRRRRKCSQTLGPNKPGSNQDDRA